MKKIYLSFWMILSSFYCTAQGGLNNLLNAGLDDAKVFAVDYLKPATEGLSYALNQGWFNNAKSNKKYKLELSIIGNTSFIKDDKKSFQMNINKYENIRFTDNSQTKNVATALGNNDPSINVIISYQDPVLGSQEVEMELPSGIGAENINLIPTAFLQGSFTVFKGTQIKARFFPKTKTDEVEIGLYGFALQQEFTAWLSEKNKFPLAVSGLIAFNHLEGEYELENIQFVNGNDQKVQTKTNSQLYQLIVGTKLNIINFHLAYGYLNASSNTNLLGTYRVLFSEDFVNPISIDSSDKGQLLTVGTNLKLGFFSISAAYSIAEFNSATLGLNFTL